MGGDGRDGAVQDGAWGVGVLVCGWSRGGVVMCWGGGATVFELDGHRFVRTFHEESKGERGSVSMAGENGRDGARNGFELW